LSNILEVLDFIFDDPVLLLLVHFLMLIGLAALMIENRLVAFLWPKFDILVCKETGDCICRYPADRVPSRTCLRPRQKARYAFTRCHVPLRYRKPPPSALDPTLPLRRDLALTRPHRLWTTPASVVGFDADTCPMVLHGPWAIEIKEGLAATVCSEAPMFPRHALTLPRCMQDVWVDDIIMTYKPYG
jgi:hypothetical protein